MQALQKRGDFQSFLKDSIAAALFPPAGEADTGAGMTGKVNQMLQQVLGAYQQDRHDE